MKWPRSGRKDQEGRPAPLAVRLLWMVGIWATSVGVLAVLALLIRFVLKSA